MPTTIDSDSKSIIKSSFKSSGGGKIWCAAVAKIYRSSERRPSEWEPFTKAGALLFLRDGKNENMFLRLLNIDMKEDTGMTEVIWEHELYLHFNYKKATSYFYVFESDDCVYGIMFADTKEASDFAKNINKRIEKIGRSMSAVMDDSASIRSAASGRSGTSGSLLRSIFSRSNSTTIQDETEEKSVDKKKEVPKKEKTDITEDDIGDPTGFKHLSHIGFNPLTGTFDVQNIPTQWKKFFEAAGATQADLENKETAAFIVDFVEQEQKRTARKGPPPPPPPKLSKAPPPPPPKNRTVQVAPPLNNAKPSTNASKPTLSRNAPAPPPFAAYQQFVDERRKETEEQVAVPKKVPPPVSRPTANQSSQMSLNDALLSSIRNTGTSQLKHIERSDPPELPPSPSLEAAPNDAMAQLLAKALQSRNKVMAHSESEGDEW